MANPSFIGTIPQNTDGSSLSQASKNAFLQQQPGMLGQKHQTTIKNIQDLPIQLNSRDELIQWLINIHNNVNKLNNKDILSYEDVKKVYLNSYNYSIEKDESVESNMTFILAIILVILIIYYFLKK